MKTIIYELSKQAHYAVLNHGVFTPGCYAKESVIAKNALSVLKYGKRKSRFLVYEGPDKSGSNVKIYFELFTDGFLRLRTIIYNRHNEPVFQEDTPIYSRSQSEDIENRLLDRVRNINIHTYCDGWKIDHYGYYKPIIIDTDGEWAWKEELGPKVRYTLNYTEREYVLLQSNNHGFFYIKTF